MKKVVLGLVLLVLTYGLVALGLAFHASGQNAVFRAQLSKIDELGRAVAPSLVDAPPLPLSYDCKALPAIDARQVVAYFVEPAAGTVDDFEFLPKRAVLSLSDDGVKDEGWPWFEHNLKWFFMELLSDTPDNWPRHLSRWNAPFGHDFVQAKYLVVHRLDLVTRPRVFGDNTYKAGQFDFHSAVLDAQTGKVLCRGNASVTSKREIRVRGHGRTDFEAEQNALEQRDKELLTDLGHESRWFGLGELCWLGGEPLCAATFRPFEPPKAP